MFSVFIASSAYLGVIGLGAGLVLLVGEIDFSLGTVAYLCGGIMDALAVNQRLPGIVAIALALLVGAGLGLLNGVLVAMVRLPSAYATLMGALVNLLCLGLLQQALSQQGIANDQLAQLGSPGSMALIFCTLLLLLWFLLRRTEFGRGVYAIGRDARQAEKAGVPMRTIRVASFMAASTLAAIGGILFVAWVLVAFPSADESLLLFAVAVPIIGGISLFGGRGSIWGVLLGAPLCAAIRLGAGLASQGPNRSIASNYAVLASVGLIVAVTIAIFQDVRRRQSAVEEDD
jgi:ribose/xylose/arabinose/galactoside ABC-type transport system permease subunit